MLTCNNIKKSFGEIEVLKGVSIELNNAEIVAIVGPSGAGKTTLLQILGTLLNTDHGDVVIDNQNITQLSPKEIATIRNQKIGFVFQFHHLLPEFSALENVMLPALIAKIPHKEAKEKALELLKLVGLEERITHKKAALSGGEQQRVAVARALINDPKIIFADEPSGNLDSKNRKELHDLFFTLRDKLGCAFLIVTHDNELAERSDRIITMQDGKIK